MRLPSFVALVLASVALSSIQTQAQNEIELFEAMVNFTDREVQILLREVDQKDLVVGLSGASAALSERFLSNMSERVRLYMLDEMEYLGSLDAATVRQTQQRIIEQAMQLSAQGQIGWPPGTGSTAPPQTQEIAAPERSAELLDLLARPLNRLSFEEIAALFAELTRIAGNEGILAWESIESYIVDPQLRAGISLAVDGTEPALIRDIMETELRSLTFYQEVHYLVIIEGIMSIYSGDNPHIVNHKLSVIYKSGSDGRPVDNPALDDLREHIVALAEKARREGLVALVSEAEREQDELLKTALYLVIDEVEPSAIIDLLEARMKVLLHDYQLRKKLLGEGVIAIQSGDNPEEIRLHLRDFYTQAAQQYELRF